MHGTTFRNASGLPDPRQITTARDYTVLARALLRDYPKYYPYFATRGFTFRGNWYHNHNRLLDQFDGLDGIKTGFVNASGYNLVASGERNGRRLIGVVMGGTSPASRDVRMAELLEAGFAKPAGRRAPEIREARAPAAPAQPEMRDLYVTAAGPTVPAAAPVLGRPEPMRLVVAAKEAHVRPPQAGGWREEGGDSWSIQVGAFSRKDAAGRAIKAAQQKAGKLLRDSTGSIMIQDDKLFRARFVGLDEREARGVCKQLGERTFPCAVIPPGAASVARAD
ncbi:MAG: SPOR domain-containing protein, partial [Alphaproteobacteria bacterium]